MVVSSRYVVKVLTIDPITLISPLKVNAHLLFGGGDIPAVAKVAGVSSHNASCGCRFCTIVGQVVDRTMTFVSEEPSERPRLREAASFKRIDLDAGQKKVTQFGDLLSFHGASFFPVDIMHMLGLGIAKQFWTLISTNKYDTTHDNNPLALPPSDLKAIGREIANSRPLSPDFAGDCGDVYKRGGCYRAVDWLHFMLYLVPTIVIRYFDDRECRGAILDLVNVFSIACSRELHKAELDRFDASVNAWLKWLRKQVDDKQINGTVFTINQHYLTDLHSLAKHLGPLPFYAAFGMERAIGDIKRHINSERDPGTNASNVMVHLAAIRSLQRLDVEQACRRTPRVYSDSPETDGDADYDMDDDDMKGVNFGALFPRSEWETSSLPRNYEIFGVSETVIDIWSSIQKVKSFLAGGFGQADWYSEDQHLVIMPKARSL